MAFGPQVEAASTPLTLTGVQRAHAKREHLVRDVEEGQVLLLLHHVGDLLPLLVRRVDTRGVVRAACEQRRRVTSLGTCCEDMETATTAAH